MCIVNANYGPKKMRYSGWLNPPGELVIETSPSGYVTNMPAIIRVSNIRDYLNYLHNEIMLLSDIYDGWVQYNDALIEALDSIPDETFSVDVTPDKHSLAHIFRHIALGRIEWLVRINAPSFDSLAMRVPEWKTLPDGVRFIVADSFPLERTAIRTMLIDTAAAIDTTLKIWDTASLGETYRHPFRGTVYAVSKQWTLVRILMHDVHHGGQLSILLQQHGIEPLKLVWLGGHLPEPGLWPED